MLADPDRGLIDGDPELVQDAIDKERDWFASEGQVIFRHGSLLAQQVPRKYGNATSRFPELHPSELQPLLAGQSVSARMASEFDTQLV